MSRKYNVSLVTVDFCHVVPPSTVRNTVDPAPLAHTTFLLAALTPRNRTLTPLVWTVQCGTTNSINMINIERVFVISMDHTNSVGRFCHIQIFFDSPERPMRSRKHAADFESFFWDRREGW